ncbi:riboflavin synthase [Halorhodospira neutriphila]|uniref:Riboflavin synthase n=1 Tax=Halorhodospira neutriphila TaxID=168379 RepID=A0ABS1E2K5_9GAMM|nr:riboflavin synthase [Halorhodospira neutriphila]MBK1726015.1 riboflavin synthase [Halorhodospira neutriphila]
MFTGIVQAVGRVAEAERRGSARRLSVEAPGLGLAGSAMGDSVAVDGVCLTAAALHGERFTADVSDETLRCTTLGALGAGARVNLELAVTPSTPLGGHLVTGHVDGVGEVVAREAAGGSERWRFRLPEGLARYVAVKGSVAVAGVSLTVNAVAGREFEVNLVPHTLAATTLGERRPGDPVNIEVDLLARYVERLLGGAPGAEGGGLSLEQLRRAGYGE